MASPGWRAFWLRHLHRWHWISAALSLVGILTFTITGVMLNHADSIEAKAKVTTRTAQLPQPLLKTVEEAAREGSLPDEVRRWIAANVGVSIAAQNAEWHKDEVYVSLPRPGGDAWLTIDRASGAIEYELTDRGVVAFLNDLHKGRSTGLAWSLFIDAFAAVCLVFCITGFFLLQMQSARRPATWPVVGLGVVIPIVLILLFVH